jgi:hypothetical protein
MAWIHIIDHQRVSIFSQAFVQRTFRPAPDRLEFVEDQQDGWALPFKRERKLFEELIDPLRKGLALFRLLLVRCAWHGFQAMLPVP